MLSTQSSSSDVKITPILSSKPVLIGHACVDAACFFYIAFNLDNVFLALKSLF